MTVAAAMEYAASGGAEPLSRKQFEDFYSRTAPALLNYIRRVAGNSAIAEDVLQESYIRLLNAPELTEQQRKSYLYRTATNLVTDYHRAQARQRRWWERRTRQSEAVDCKLDLGPDMERMFVLLTARERALLWLAYVEQAEHREIAEILGIGEKNVKVALHRARVKMEGVLKAHGFEGAK